MIGNSVEELASLIKNSKGTYQLSYEQEKDCHQHAIHHNLQGAGVDALVLSNRGRMWLIVHEFNKNGKFADIVNDMFQAGMVGLIESIGGYDPKKGFRFWTYAKFQVRKRIREAIENDHLIIIHRGEARERRLVKTFIERFREENGYFPKISQISNALNLLEETVILCIEALDLMKQLGNQDSFSPIDEQFSGDNVESQVLRLEVQSAMREAFLRLPDQQRRVLSDVIMHDQVRGAGGYRDSHAQRLKQAGVKAMRGFLIEEGIQGEDALNF